MTTAITTSDISTILTKFGDINSFLSAYLPLAESIPGLSSLLKTATAPLKGIDQKYANVIVGTEESSIRFNLPDGSTVSFIVSNDIVQKISAGDNSYLLAVSYVANPDTLKSLFAGTPFAGLAPSSCEIVVSTQDVTSVGGVDVHSGISVIGSFDVAHSTNDVLSFLHNYAGADTVSAIVSINKNHQSLSGDVQMSASTPKLGDFELTYEELSFAMETTVGVAAFTAGQVLTLSGYDPTQDSEPDLRINSGFKFDPNSVSLYGQVDTGGAGWSNPFGISAGTTIRSLGMQVGLTYAATTGIDNLGFVLDLEQKIGGQAFDYTLAVAFDVNSPTENAFQFTVNKPVNLVELQAITYTSTLGPIGKTVFAQLDPLFKYIDITLVSTSSNGVFAPLVKVVPVETTIAATHLDAGYGINAIVNVFGKSGTLELNANADLTQIDGSLTISELKWGNYVNISGAVAGTDLTASFNLDAASHTLSLAGSGKLEVAGFTIAKADFNITDSEIDIQDTFLDFGIARFDIDHLNVNLSSGAASGLATIKVAGSDAGMVAFTANSHLLDFNTKLTFGGVFTVDGHMTWDGSKNVLAGAGTAKIGGNTVANSSLMVSSDGMVSITGKLVVQVAQVGSVTTSLTATYDNNSHATKLNVQADVSGLGHISLNIGANEDIGKAIAHEVSDLVGEQASWVVNAVTSGAASLVDAGNFKYTAEKITSFVNDVGGEAGQFFNNLFGTGRQHDKARTTMDDDSGHTLEGNGGNDILFGNGGVDTIQGFQGKDLLDGGTGDDFIYGGSDNDVINGGNGDDIIEGQGGGDIIYGGFNNDKIYGDWADNKQRNKEASGYNDGDDELHGGAGYDDLRGGWGNDTLFGDSGDDSLDGNQGYDHLYGGVGNDRLMSTGGVAVMDGGAGDDTFVVSSSDSVIVEGTNQGTDKVEARVVNPEGARLNNGYALPANVENLTIDYGARINGFGNNLDNVIVGSTAFNEIWAGEGNDTLDGGGVANANDYADILHGGTGNDTYLVNDSRVQVLEAANEGTDTVKASVSYTLTAQVENLTLIGTTAISGTGNGLNNVLTGNSGNNYLSGGTGADVMSGGEGNDTFYVDNVGDTVNELSNQGSDTVIVSFSYTLPSNVEKLTLTGSATIDGTGNELNNVLTGNAGNNVLTGGAGNDWLSGGVGNDTLSGGSGADIFQYARGAVSTKLEDNGKDLIRDFSPSDILRVTDENFSAASFVTSATNLVRNQIHVSNAGGYTLLQIGTTNRSGGEPIQITLTGTFSSSDFSANGTDIWLTNP